MIGSNSNQLFIFYRHGSTLLNLEDDGKTGRAEHKTNKRNIRTLDCDKPTQKCQAYVLSYRIR